MGTMKGGKDDEKSMRPLFPRVHVSDTEKGGPRAPPRNKMALYEQLSIPSQKFSSATLPPHKPGSVVPSASSIQGGTHERTAYSPFYLPHSTLAPSAEKSYFRSCDGRSIKTRGMEFEKCTDHVDYKTSRAARSGAEGSAFNVLDITSGKKSFKAKYDDDNDDFRVPTLAQAEVAPHSKDAPLVEVNRPASFGGTNVQNPTTLDSSIHVLSSSSKPIHEANASGKLSRKRERLHAEQESRETISSKEHGDEFPEMLADPSKISSAPSDRGAEANLKLLDKTVYQSSRMGNESSHNGSVDLKFLENGNAYKMRSRSSSGPSFGYSQGSHDDKANGSGELKDTERSGEVSEASMLDSISGLDISPDDVVGIIGLKQFWKARRAIVNQQRVFATQVFELHRLIKVQKLFAASPHLLLDDSHIITIQPKAATKSLSIASNLKYQQVVQQRDHSSQKPSQNADPLLEKAAAPPPQAQERDPNKELGQLPRNVPHTANTHPIPIVSDNRPNPWCFPPPANQWLVPVMSPSEGLIYKPYAGPCPPTSGFMAPLYGSCGPLSMVSVSGDFVNSAYGIPSITKSVTAIGPNYFPAPYGMSMVNQVISAAAVDQVSPLTIARPIARPSGRSMQHSQSSCNISITQSEALSGHHPKKNASKDSELHASTASSPCATAQGEGRDVLPLFPIPPAAKGSCQPSESSGKKNQTHVIKVVPHNARLATESAARIFRSIQKERQQLDL